MGKELMALERNKIRDLVQVSSNKKPIGCQWVYTIKDNYDGTIDRYKTRLVARG